MVLRGHRAGHKWRQASKQGSVVGAEPRAGATPGTHPRHGRHARLQVIVNWIQIGSIKGPSLPPLCSQLISARTDTGPAAAEHRAVRAVAGARLAAALMDATEARRLAGTAGTKAAADRCVVRAVRAVVPHSADVLEQARVAAIFQVG